MTAPLYPRLLYRRAYVEDGNKRYLVRIQLYVRDAQDETPIAALESVRLSDRKRRKRSKR